MEKIKKWIEDHNGYLIVKELKEIVPYHKIKYFIKKTPDLIKVQQGIYRTEDAWEDYIYERTTNNPNLVLSHESALYLHNLMERQPNEWNVTTFQGNNTKDLKSSFIIFHTKKEHLYLGLTTMKTIFGNEVRLYNMERTICDMIKHEKFFDAEVYNKAWNYFMQREDKNLDTLLLYAKKLRVLKTVKMYLLITYDDYSIV